MKVFWILQQKWTKHIILCAIPSKHRWIPGKARNRISTLTLSNLNSCNSVNSIKLMQQEGSLWKNIPDLHFHGAQVTGVSIHFISVLRLNVLIFTDKQHVRMKQPILTSVEYIHMNATAFGVSAVTWRQHVYSNNHRVLKETGIYIKCISSWN